MSFVPGNVVVFNHKNKWKLDEYNTATLKEDWSWDLGTKVIENGSVFMVLECYPSDGGFVRAIGADRKRVMIPTEYLRLL